jgi:hypothetical protein
MYIQMFVRITSWTHLFIYLHLYVCIVKVMICLRGVEGLQTLPNDLQISTCIFITISMCNTSDDVDTEIKTITSKSFILISSSYPLYHT